MIRIAALVVSLAATSAWASAHGNRIPVMIGSDSSLDACSGLDAVSGLRSGRLVVRSGPGLRYAAIDSLQNGQSVYSCDSSGEWTGIVYKPGARTPETPECGVVCLRADSGLICGARFQAVTGVAPSSCEVKLSHLQPMSPYLTIQASGTISRAVLWRTTRPKWAGCQGLAFSLLGWRSWARECFPESFSASLCLLRCKRSPG
jgi:hypothetical protein